MAQVSWRADDELVDRAKRAARRSARSLNEYLTLLVVAATDPDVAGTEVEALRERLGRAGLLEDPPGRRLQRPAAAAVAAAGERAATGTLVSDLVAKGR